MKIVTAAIIYENGKILLARRAQDQNLAGMWEFPGGKREERESVQECLVRELNEELNIDTSVTDVIAKSIYEYTHGKFEIVALKTRVLSGSYSLTVHDEIEWVALDQLQDYQNILPADKELIPAIQRYILVENSYAFYKNYFGTSFTEQEEKSLLEKVRILTKEDIVIKNSQLADDLYRNALYLIYFLGEYKKAYLYSICKKKEKNTNSCEALGKGFPAKQKAYEIELSNALDPSLSMDNRLIALFKNLVFLLLKKHSYKKVSMAFLGIIYINFGFIKQLINLLHEESIFMQKSLSAMDKTLKYFEYTHVAPSKVLNSSLIIIYTHLVQNAKMEKELAFKEAKYFVNTYIDGIGGLTDKYRQSFLVSNDIYCTGIYQGLPIFQWYIDRENKPYYAAEDIKKLRVLFRIIFSESNYGFTSAFLTQMVFKILRIQQSSDHIKNIFAIKKDNQAISHLLKTLHLQFVNTPFSLLSLLPQRKKPLILKIISQIVSFFTNLSTPKPNSRK